MDDGECVGLSLNHQVLVLVHCGVDSIVRQIEVSFPNKTRVSVGIVMERAMVVVRWDMLLVVNVKEDGSILEVVKVVFLLFLSSC